LYRLLTPPTYACLPSDSLTSYPGLMNLFFFHVYVTARPPSPLFTAIVSLVSSREFALLFLSRCCVLLIEYPANLYSPSFLSFPTPFSVLMSGACTDVPYLCSHRVRFGMPSVLPPPLPVFSASGWWFVLPAIQFSTHSAGPSFFGPGSTFYQ